MTVLRIGTWNVEGKWTPGHGQVLDARACDLWLLTELPTRVRHRGFHQHATSALMGTRKHWAAILSRQPIEPMPDPHPASVAARVSGQLVCCSVLPWLAAGPHWPWGPADHVGRVQSTLGDLTAALQGGRPVWGGDWNQPFGGSLTGFARAATPLLTEAVERLGLQVVTSRLPARGGSQWSIDHIAVPENWDATTCEAVQVPSTLSDHDLYWLDVETGS